MFKGRLALHVGVVDKIGSRPSLRLGYGGEKDYRGNQILGIQLLLAYEMGVIYAQLTKGIQNATTLIPT